MGIRIAGFGLLIGAAYLGSRILVRFGLRAPNAFLGVTAVLAFGVRLVRSRLAARQALAPSGEASGLPPPSDQQVRPGIVNNLWVAMPAAWSTDRLIDFVLASMQRHGGSEEIVTSLLASGFSEDDAHLAIDRTVGGLVRAQTRNPRNEPSRLKDPIAWLSYRRGLERPELVGVLGSLPGQPGPI